MKLNNARPYDRELSSNFEARSEKFAVKKVRFNIEEKEQSLSSILRSTKLKLIPNKVKVLTAASASNEQS